MLMLMLKLMLTIINAPCSWSRPTKVKIAHGEIVHIPTRLQTKLFSIVFHCFPIVFKLFSNCFSIVFRLLSNYFPIVFSILNLPLPEAYSQAGRAGLSHYYRNLLVAYCPSTYIYANRFFFL